MGKKVLFQCDNDLRARLQAVEGEVEHWRTTCARQADIAREQHARAEQAEQRPPAGVR